MTIDSIKLFKVAVPLKKVVRHASFERSVSENLVVRVTLGRTASWAMAKACRGRT